jgi:hypothetical protein
MADEYKFHCIFCHRSFFQELLPILGFTTARACDECLNTFKEALAVTAAIQPGSDQDQ